MNNKPTVSIILPLYNVEKYVSKCLDSIIAQDNTDCINEIIIVNDGSTDNSLAIVEQFAREYPNIKIINQKNKGVSAARNCGILNASGKYCCFVDSDDYLESNYLSTMIYAIEDYSVDIVCCGVYASEKLDGNFAGVLCSDKNIRMNREEAIMALFSKKTFSGWPYNKLYRLNIIQDNDIKYDESIKYCEDEVFVLEYLMHCDSLVFIKDVLYHYMYNESSVNNKMITIDKSFNYNALDRLKADKITYSMIRPLLNKELYHTVMARYFMSTVLTMNKFFSNGYNGDEVTLILLKRNLRKYYWYYVISKNWKVGVKDLITKTLLVVFPKLYYRLKKLN